MTKRLLLRIISALGAVVMMIGIFCMSAQTGEESGELSGNVTETILEQVDPQFPALPPQEKEQKVESVGAVIRKIAHYCEFFALGFFLIIFTFTYEKIKYHVGALISFAAGVLYAVSDELHQLFVSDRGCAFRDVVIDSSGVLCAIFIVWGITLIIMKNKNNSKEELCLEQQTEN